MSSMTEPKEQLNIPVQEEGAAAPQKQGGSSDTARSAEEIMAAINKEIDNSPEAASVRALIQNFEAVGQKESVIPEPKRGAAGSTTSSNSGSWTQVSVDDDAMKPRLHRTKTPPPQSGSRPPTPDSKRKHPGSLRERLEKKRSRDRKSGIARRWAGQPETSF